MEFSEAIQSLVSEKPSNRAISIVFNEASTIANAYLAMKINHPVIDGMCVKSDLLATDLIAELFKRDDEGQFPEFIAWFSLFTSTIRFEDIYIAFRKRIFAEINDQWFRLCKEWDPSLSKIIRNLKRVFKDNEGAHFFKEHHNSWIGYKNTADSGVSRWSIEELFMAISMRRSGFVSIVELPSLLDEIFKDEWTSCRPSVPLSELALAYRQYCVGLHNEESEETPDIFEPEFYENLLQEAQECVKIDPLEKYVLDGKITQDLANMYLEVITLSLKRQFLAEDDEKSGYRKILEELEETEMAAQYKEKHRSTIEYLGKSMKVHFLNLVKHQLKIQQV